MATRFYFRATSTAPVTVAVDAAWESSASPFVSKAMFTTTDAADTLTNVTGFSSTTGQDRCHRQWISQPMAASLTFNTGITYKCYAQCLESQAGDNIKSRLGLRIVSEDGTTVRHTILAVADYSTATEWNTASRNKAFANGDAGVGSYVTVAGDRLVVEIGHNDTTGTTIEGRSRWGSAGSTDLGENETSTSTTERPWFEMSLTTTFATMTPQSLSMSGVGTATNVKSVGVNRAFAGVGSMGVAKRVGLNLGMSGVGTANLLAGLVFNKLIDSIAIGTASLSRTLGFGVLINSVAVGTASLSERLVLSVLIDSVAVGTMSLVNRFIGSVSLAMSAIGSLTLSTLYIAGGVGGAILNMFSRSRGRRRRH